MEAILYIGSAARKNRGRPKKVKVANEKEQEEPVSPGPSKGSVMDGYREECMDPGEKEAILDAGGGGGPGPPGGGKSGQLASDSGGG
jgi:hypothetical protein